MSKNLPGISAKRVQKMEEETHEMIEGVEQAETEFSDMMDEAEKTKEALNQAMHGLEKVDDILEALNNAKEMGADKHPDAADFEQTLDDTMENLYIAKVGLEHIKDKLDDEEQLTTSLEEADIKVEDGILKVAKAIEHDQYPIDPSHTKRYIDNLRSVISEERRPENFD